MGGAVHQLGTRAHHERFLRKIATLELPGAFAMTEACHGSDVQHLETTATWDPETKEFVVHTPSDEARKGTSGTPRVMDGWLSLTAEGVYESPIENANKRFFTMLGTLVQGRVCVSGASVSAAKTALTIATRYGLRSNSSGRPTDPRSRSSITAPISGG